MTLIMGRPTLTFAELVTVSRALGATALFVDEMIPALWKAALRYGIDPTAMVAQSAHETGWGRYAGNVPASWNNPCGLKVVDQESVLKILGSTNPDHPCVHACFADRDTGACAQGQHLRIYCQLDVDDVIVSPRYWIVRRINITSGRAPAVHLLDLNGKWAGPRYGEYVEAVADRLRKAAGR